MTLLMWIRWVRILMTIIKPWLCKARIELKPARLTIHLWLAPILLLLTTTRRNLFLFTQNLILTSQKKLEVWFGGMPGHNSSHGSELGLGLGRLRGSDCRGTGRPNTGSILVEAGAVQCCIWNTCKYFPQLHWVSKCKWTCKGSPAIKGAFHSGPLSCYRNIWFF